MSSRWHKVETICRNEDWNHCDIPQWPAENIYDCDLIAHELREWAKANSRGRSKVNVRRQTYRKYVIAAKFKEKQDAALFKLFWWNGDASLEGDAPLEWFRWKGDERVYQYHVKTARLLRRGAVN